MRVVGVVMAAVCVLAACGGPEAAVVTLSPEPAAEMSSPASTTATAEPTRAAATPAPTDIASPPETTAATLESVTAAATPTPEPPAITSTPATTAAIPDLETAATPTPEPATVTPTPAITTATPESARAAATPAPEPTAVTPDAQPPPTDESEFARVVRLMCERYADPAFRASLHVGQRILDAEFRELDELRQALGVDEQTFGIALVKRCSELHWEVASHLHLFSLRARALIDRRMFAVCELLRDPTLAQRLADRPGDVVVTRALEEELHGLLGAFHGEYTGLVFSVEGFDVQMEHFCPELVQPIVAAGGTVGGNERMWRAREHAREACAAFEQALMRPESSRAEAVARALTTMRSDTSGVGVPEDTIRATLRASCPDTVAAVAALVGHAEFETELDRLAEQACARLRDPIVTAQLVDSLPNIYDPAYDAIVRAVRDAGLGFGEFAAAVRDQCPEIISLRPSGLVPPGYSHRELPPTEFFQGVCDGLEVLAGLPADERAERLGALVLLLLATVDESELETELMLAIVLQACGGPLPPDLAI